MATPAPSKRITPKGKKATSAKDWKSNSRRPVLLELPSGNKCLAINRGLKMFRDQGMIPNALLPIVNKALNEGQGIKPKQQAQEVLSVEMLPQILEFADAVVVSCVVDPDIQPAPKAEIQQGDDLVWVVVEDEPVTDINGQVVRRDPEALYVDECDLEDKMFVMDWAMGGVRDLERFRAEQAAAMADLQTGEGVEREA